MPARSLLHALACALVIGAASAAGAQSAPPRLAEGRVLRPSEGGGPRPVAGQWIVLHRVGSDRAAPIDSVRSASDGRFRFRYTPFGDPDALYFISAHYGGIAYFSPPLRADTVRGDDADVIVYDTTTDTTAVRVQGRHFVLSAPHGDRREIAEVFELENDGTRTLIARDTMVPLWSSRLPAGAESTSVAPGDVSSGAVLFRNGRAELYAPISPGVRQLVLTYMLPVKAFPLTMPVERPVSVLEVLLEEPRAAAEGARLAEVAPGVIEGRQFRRFLAQDVPANAVMRVTAPAPMVQSRDAMKTLAVVMVVLMLSALAVWQVKRRGRLEVRGLTSDVKLQTSNVERLVAELATMDARFERTEKTEAARAAYHAKRAELKGRIERALAAEKTPV